ncbi:hypothetical protein H3T80_02935 [Gilliamella sp. W8145]|uniref:Uncharacterized protein n=1 Tax=Gilliamella apis TaxID=1970738 RepID=A0A2V4DS75_9GAMM|nr:hypothetical protein [Gilliamella sp. W8145]PXY91944.1 hypothetical protein DKK78_06430 [Gilliamella apis]
MYNTVFLFQLKFEARLKHTYLEKHNIPRNLFKFIKYQKDNEKKEKMLLESYG